MRAKTELKIRGTAVAFASFTQWVFNFLIVLLFPYFLESVGGATTFLFLAAMSCLQWLFTYLYVPETKGRSLEEIERIWTRGKKRTIADYSIIINSDN